MKKIFKTITTFMICAVLMLSLIACGNGGGQEEPGDKEPEEDKEVELYVDLHGWMPTLNEEATAENPEVFRSPQIIADAFMEMYPNIKIRWARTKPVGGDSEDLAEWFTTQINAETVPAIAFSWGTQYQDRGWYVDLDEYLDQPNPYVDGNEKWKDLFPGYLWSVPTIASANKSIVAIPIALYPGPATGYYYNIDAFEDAGIDQQPNTWEELIEANDKLEASGYRGIGPWGFFNSVAADTWVAQFCLGPSSAGYIFDQVDYDDNGFVETAELLRAVKDGLFNPVEHDYAKEYYRQQKRYFTEVLYEGWEGTDLTGMWNTGELGMKEEGLWALQAEHNNRGREFDFGIFPAPLMSTDTTEYAIEIEYTEAGPYQPDPDLQLNIMRHAVEGKPEVLDAAVKFLQFLTTPENNSMMVLEQGSDIGAVRGADVPPVLSEWLNQPFPKTPNIDWPQGFTEEQNLAINRNFQNYVNGQMSEEDFFVRVNELQQQGADDYIDRMDIDTSDW